MNFSLALFLWVIAPMLLGLIMSIGSLYNSDVLEAYVCGNPVVQTIVIMDGAGGENNAMLPMESLNYNWPEGSLDKVNDTTFAIIASFFIYALVGFFFAWRAKCRFRKKIF